MAVLIRLSQSNLAINKALLSLGKCVNVSETSWNKKGKNEAREISVMSDFSLPNCRIFYDGQ